MLVLWLSLLSCTGSVQRVLPGGPVLSAEDPHFVDGVVLPDVDYTAPPLVSYTFPPLQLFGIYYDVDVVIVSDHPDWDMHEYARLSTPQGHIWLAKDSDQDLVQTISADIPDIRSWAPEVPVPRQQVPTQVTEHWNGRRLSFEMAYTNPAGEPVEVRFQGVLPRKPPRLRNGNTMGHSQQAVAAVLDLERFGHRADAEITINGEPRRIERLLGVYSMQFLLQQAQAGFAITDYRVTSTDDNTLTVTRPGGDIDWPTQSTEEWTRHTDGNLTLLTTDDGFVAHTQAFTNGGLAWAEVTQHGRDVPVLRVTFSPALPDLRRPFQGEVESRFRLDVNGQIGHGEGVVRARWADDSAVILELEPTAPDWLRARPMVGNIRFSKQSARVQLHRIP